LSAHENLEIVAANVLDPSDVANVTRGHDAVLSAIGSSGSSVEVIPEAARSLVEGLDRSGSRRLIVVGGAGVLEVEPGVQFVDSPSFYEPYRPLALAHRDAYNLYQASDLDWTLVCPAGEIAPGERTGRFQVGADRLLTNSQGESRISAEDYAIAFMNEVEQPQYIHQRMTVAY
jgi:putative NADH-flavin reductase